MKFIHRNRKCPGVSCVDLKNSHVGAVKVPLQHKLNTWLAPISKISTLNFPFRIDLTLNPRLGIECSIESSLADTLIKKSLSGGLQPQLGNINFSCPKCSEKPRMYQPKSFLNGAVIKSPEGFGVIILTDKRGVVQGFL
jgi:hypothetical protein